MDKQSTLSSEFGAAGPEARAARGRMNSLRVLVAFAVIGLVDLGYLASHELRASTPLSLFYIGVLISTIVGGVLPGLIAIALGFLSAWFMNEPPEFSFGLDLEVAASLLVYLLTATAVFLVAWRLLVAEGRSVSLLDWLFRRD